MKDKKEIAKKKKIILTALAKTIKELRGKQSQFKFCSENDIPIDIISKSERGMKDPQLTTIFKMAEAFSLSPEEFVAKISSKLPENFYLIER